MSPGALRRQELHESKLTLNSTDGPFTLKAHPQGISDF